MINAKNTLLIAAACLLLASCNSNDYAAKYEAAMRYYNDNSFSKAIQLFENLTLHYRGKENAENIAWYYAMSLYQEKDYYTAGYQFKRFARQFPYSEHVEEAAWLAAYCHYKESPVYSLDQRVTHEAIEEMETFTERFPRSLHIPEANNYLDEMRNKLMKKDYEIAYGYYYIEEYPAAYVSFKQFLNLYSDSPMREEAMYYQLESGFRLAMGSREEKRRERLQQVLNDFDKFSSTFANSKHMSAAQNFYTQARATLTDMETTNTEK